MKVIVVNDILTTYACNGRKEVADTLVALALEKRGEEDAPPQSTDSEDAE